MNDSAAADPIQPWTRWHTIAVVLAITFGWGLRLVAYLANPSLWNDEQLLGLNIGRRSALALLRPLDHDQAAPVGFLLLERLITRVLGMNDLALRLLPFLAGLALVVFGVLLARRLARPDAVVLAALLFAVSRPAMIYTRQLKPYEFDITMSALLLWLAVRVLDEGTPAHWRALTIGAVAALLLSAPALFIVAAITPALLLARQLRGDAAWRRRAFTALATWLVAGVVVYLAFLRPSSEDHYLHEYMEATFLPLTAGLPAEAWRLYSDELLRGALVPASTLGAADGVFAVLTVVLAAGGLIVLARRRGLALAMLLAAPFALSFAAAVLQVYPVTGRLQLWLLPPLIVLVVVALDTAVALLRSPAWQHGAMALAALAVLATGGRSARYRAFHVTPLENPRPVVATWREANSRLPVYVAARGAPAWTFYTTDWENPDTARLDWYAVRISSGGVAFRNAAGRGPVRQDGDDLVWPLASRTELLGTPSGMMVTLAGLSQEEPDSGWADNEARRIRAAAAPEIWMFFAHHIRSEHHVVLAAVQAQGGQVLRTIEEPGAALYLVSFPP